MISRIIHNNFSTAFHFHTSLSKNLILDCAQPVVLLVGYPGSRRRHVVVWWLERWSQTTATGSACSGDNVTSSCAA
jgi:hypothetical protein